MKFYPKYTLGLKYALEISVKCVQLHSKLEKEQENVSFVALSETPSCFAAGIW